MPAREIQRNVVITITRPTQGASFDLPDPGVLIVEGTASCTDTTYDDRGNVVKTVAVPGEIVSVTLNLGDKDPNDPSLFLPATKADGATWERWTFPGSTRLRKKLTITARVTAKPRPLSGEAIPTAEA